MSKISINFYNLCYNGVIMEIYHLEFKKYFFCHPIWAKLIPEWVTPTIKIVIFFGRNNKKRSWVFKKSLFSSKYEIIWISYEWLSTLADVFLSKEPFTTETTVIAS